MRYRHSDLRSLNDLSTGLSREIFRLVIFDLEVIMNAKVLLWGLSALAITTSTYATDSKSEMDDCKHPVNSASARAKGETGFVLWEKPRAVPTLAFQDGEGKPLSLNNFRGKVLVLNLWATWCRSCGGEMASLGRLQAKLGGQNLEVLALSIDHAGPKAVRDFVREFGVKHLRLYIDPTAQTPTTLGVIGIPATLLLDPQGRELGRLLGPATWDSQAMLKFLEGVIRQTKGDAS